MINPFDRPKIEKMRYEEYIDLLKNKLTRMGDGEFFDELGMVSGRELGRLFTTRPWITGKLHLTDSQINEVFPGKQRFTTDEVIDLLTQLTDPSPKTINTLIRFL